MIEAHLDKAELRKFGKVLDSLDYKVRKKVVRAANTGAGRSARKAVRTAAPKRTGGMRASVAIKNKIYADNGVGWMVVGVRAGWNKNYTIAKKVGGKTIKTTIKVVPSNVVHLVIYGHRMVVGGTLSRDQSKAGLGRDGGRRTTQRSATNKARTGQGRVVGVVPGDNFFDEAFNKAKGEMVREWIRAGRDKIYKEAKKAALEHGAL